jgi:uncharacterized protein YjiS (DUF1127 family)
MIMSTISTASEATQVIPDPPGASRLRNTLTRWWVAYMGWRIERAAVAHLATLSDRELKDIGLSRTGIPGAVREGSRVHAIRYY